MSSSIVFLLLSLLLRYPMPSQNINQPQSQPVIVKKVVQYKRKRSLVDFLIGTIVLLAIIIVLGAFISVSAWLYTYKALTEEKTVGELYISAKVIKDGVPTTRVRYVALQEQPGYFLGQESVIGEETRKDLSGDQVFVDTNFIRFENWGTLIGLKPVYKVYRVKSDFSNINDRENFRSSAFELNGGADQFIVDFEQNQDNFRWIVQSAYISSAGINVTDQDQRFDVKVTKDGVVLEKK
jgi:hypothetical protein